MAKNEFTEHFIFFSSALGLFGSFVVGLLGYIWHSRIKDFNDKLSTIKESLKDFKLHYDNFLFDNKKDIERLHKRIDTNKDCIASAKKDVNGIGEKLEGQIRICEKEHRND